MGPLYDRLRNYRIWTVVPYGWLHAFPFHCAMDTSGYLVDRHIFTFAPSGSVYLHCQKTARNEGSDILLFGYSDEFAPSIADELQQVHSLFPQARLFLQEEAQSENLQQYGSAASMIHIASHGRYVKDQPFSSGLLLSDGWLTVPQIYGMKWNAELVTLSGCETGAGQVSAGDELLGLTRAFLYAGTSSILVSLWRVSDESTAFFMKTFYQALARGSGKCDAWHEAVLTTKARWSHPYHWAPFLLVGKI
jgi:CHAT domain-containing protein